MKLVILIVIGNSEVSYIDSHIGSSKVIVIGNPYTG